jgi:hypothetical protein
MPAPINRDELQRLRKERMRNSSKALSFKTSTCRVRSRGEDLE